MGMSLHTERWFVDGFGGVTGPFSTFEIITKLIGNELEVTDRVSLEPKNLASWVAICNEAQFDQAIKDLLSTIVTKPGEAGGTEPSIRAKDELSGFQNITNIRIGISKQLKQAKSMEEIGSKASSLRQLQSQIAAKKKIVIEVRQEVKKELSAAESIQVIRPNGNRPQHTFIEDERQRARKQKMMTIGAAILFVGAILIKGLSNPETSGSHDEKLDVVESQNPLPPPVSVEKPKPAVAPATSLGYVSPFIAPFNKAVQHLSANELDKAEEALKQAWKVADQRDIGPLMLVSFETAWLSDVRDQQASGNSQLFPRLIAFQKLVQQHEPDITAYMEEMMVVKIVMASLLRQNELYNNLIGQWIELNPEALPAKPNLVNLDQRRTRWGHLYFWCLDVQKRDSKGGMTNAFFANCVTKAKGAKDAVPFITYAYQISPHHPQIRGLMASVLYSSGNMDELKKLLAGRTIASAGSSRLMRRTMTSLCRTDANFPACKQ